MSEQSNSQPLVMAAWKRWLLFAFVGPVYLGTSAAIGRGLFESALYGMPDLLYFIPASWFGVLVGLAWGGITFLVALNMGATGSWLSTGEWNSYSNSKQKSRY